MFGGRVTWEDAIQNLARSRAVVNFTSRISFPFSAFPFRLETFCFSTPNSFVFLTYHLLPYAVTLLRTSFPRPHSFLQWSAIWKAPLFLCSAIVWQRSNSQLAVQDITPHVKPPDVIQRLHRRAKPRLSRPNKCNEPVFHIRERPPRVPAIAAKHLMLEPNLITLPSLGILSLRRIDIQQFCGFVVLICPSVPTIAQWRRSTSPMQGPEH